MFGRGKYRNQWSRVNNRVKSLLIGRPRTYNRYYAAIRLINRMAKHVPYIRPPDRIQIFRCVSMRHRGEPVNFTWVMDDGNRYIDVFILSNRYELCEFHKQPYSVLTREFSPSQLKQLVAHINESTQLIDTTVFLS